MPYGATAYATGTYAGASSQQTAVSVPPFNGTTTFITPLVQDRVTFLPDSSAIQTKLMRHYANRWPRFQSAFTKASRY